MNKKTYTLPERVTLMYERMEDKYGPNRLRRMCKDDVNKMSLLFGVERKERDTFNKLMAEEIIKRYKS